MGSTYPMRAVRAPSFSSTVRLRMMRRPHDHARKPWVAVAGAALDLRATRSSWTAAHLRPACPEGSRAVLNVCGAVTWNQFGSDGETPSVGFAKRNWSGPVRT